MQQAYVVEGSIQDARSVVLNEPLPISSGKVRVTVEPVATAENPKRPILEVMEEIWAEHRARGFVPPTKEEVDLRIKEERDSWD